MIKRLKTQISQLPQKPGVYFMKNGKEEIIYIGKAINIRKRVQSHFVNGHSFAKFYPQVRSVDYITVRTEKDALVLENQLIKKHQPKYNVEWKDDKNYAYVVFTNEKYPRLIVTRQPKTFQKKESRGRTSENEGLSSGNSYLISASSSPTARAKISSKSPVCITTWVSVGRMGRKRSGTA